MLARRKAVLDELENEIPGSKGYKCDATAPDEIAATVAAIQKDLGPIHTCIYICLFIDTHWCVYIYTCICGSLFFCKI